MIVAVTGGIGSGKSVVCRILDKMGYPVYDCDSHAKIIMDNDEGIKQAVKSQICDDAVDAFGNLNRRAISSVVFSDADKLTALNTIVHAAVKNDFMQWTRLQHLPLVFVETAILYQSGMDTLVHQVWEVTSPERLRIERVCSRNALSPQEVKARIDSQIMAVDNPHPDTRVIINDNHHSLLLQIHSLLEKS